MSKQRKILLLLSIVFTLTAIMSFRVAINTAFWAACSVQNHELIKLTVRLGANIEARDNGRTALIYAVEANQIQTAKTLLQLGANPNVTYSSGVTPLEIAEGENFNEMSKLLLRYGAKGKAKGKLHR